MKPRFHSSSIVRCGKNAADVATLSVEQITELIHESSFREAKAVQIRHVAQRAAQDYYGELPCDEAGLLSFARVGPKCAHLY